MAAPPRFQRTPRRYPLVHQDKIELPAPAAAPPVPTTSLLAIALPVAATVGGFAVIFLVTANSNTAGGLNPLMALAFSAPLMLASYLVGFIAYFGQKRDYRRKTAEREIRYHAFLQSQRKALQQAVKTQQDELTLANPAPDVCVQRAETRDRLLWSRAPQDSDFLAIRLGTGTVPSGVEIKPPKMDPVQAPDPLIIEAHAISREFMSVSNAPILVSLRTAGIVGLGGSRAAILNAARTAILNLATHHSPDEVKIIAVYPAREAAEWEWLRWLPHTWSDDRQQRFLASDRPSAHRLLTNLYEVLNRRRPPVGGTGPTNTPLPALVFILSEPLLFENEPLIPLLLGQGAQRGAYTLFLAEADALPQNCQVIVQPVTRQIQQTPAAPPSGYIPDDTPVALVQRLARALAPLRLQRLATPSEIPAAVPLLTLLGADTVEDVNVLQRWRDGLPFESLAVPLGMRAGDEPLRLDLHERGHGPHGLVAGATGSGKSELLQTLIASIATHFDPREVVFVLVDYKGGGMANVFEQLPHLVGTITNLQGNLALRALTALKSELHRRQTLLAGAGVTNIDDYQQRYRRRQVPDPLPHLILIVDEFAELKAEQPDFIKELIGAVRIGRSLGVHLILATQKPAGVVDEQIWSNARFRLCLRVERPEDSREVIKRPEAADLTTPGRAYLQVGNDEVFEIFQSGWGGAGYVPTIHGGRAVPIIREVALDGVRRSLHSLGPGGPSTESHLQALVHYIHRVATAEGYRRLPGPWLPPLPELLTLDEIRPTEGWNGQTWAPPMTWISPVIGLLDDPAHQRQEALAMPLSEGHLAIYGQPGMGKTTLVQTLITSLVLNHSPQDVNLYLLDFGSRLLTRFQPLPHVGGVVLPDDSEKFNRLLILLQRTLNTRKEEFARARVSTLPAFRQAMHEPVPAFVIVIDNYQALTALYPDAEDALLPLAREGANFGLHLVLTSTAPVRTRIGNNLTLAVTFALTDRGEYGSIVGRTGGLEPPLEPGRGLVKGNPPLEFQAALPIGGLDEAARSQALETLISDLTAAWRGAPAPPIAILPVRVALDALLATPPALDPFLVPIGVDTDDLSPFTVSLRDGPHFLITGPAQSGKTTLLQSWLLALLSRCPPQRLHLYLVDFRQSSLLPLADLRRYVKAYISDERALAEALTAIGQQLQQRQQEMDTARRAAGGILDERAFLTRYPALVLAVDDFDALRDRIQPESKDALERLIRRDRHLGAHLLLTAPAAEARVSYDGPLKALRDSQIGFILGSSDHDDLQIFNARLPAGESGKLYAPGQGLYAWRGRVRKLKAARAQSDTETLRDWVVRLEQTRGSVPRR
ncbi:MAG: type VII secretion protein EssC [Chloroflexota bacterium]|nr:type VII secretion protein EssC [Chloroflexota bacterium]